MDYTVTLLSPVISEYSALGALDVINEWKGEFLTFLNDNDIKQTNQHIK